jgi:hypothetical protein
MMKRFIGAALAAASLVVATGAAAAATIDIGQAFNGSLQEIINGAATAGVAVLVGWVAIVAKKKFNIDIEAQYRAALTAFLQRQASSLIADGAVKLNGVKITVQNDALAAAANTGLAAIPGVLKFFGLTSDAIQHMIVDMLPKQPSVAQAQAVAIDCANPATPSIAGGAGQGSLTKAA